MNPVCPKCNCTANQIGPEHYECPYCGKKFTAKIVTSNDSQPLSVTEENQFSIPTNHYAEVEDDGQKRSFKKEDEPKVLLFGIAATVITLVLLFLPNESSYREFIRTNVFLAFWAICVLVASILICRFKKFRVLAIVNIILSILLMMGVIGNFMLL